MAAKPLRVIKMILVGNGSVGKTSIIRRFVADGFARVYAQTVGIDFFEKRVQLRTSTEATMQVWDIGGQSIASRMLDTYIGGADVVFVCYDVTDSKSFADAQDWLDRVEGVLGDARKSKPVYLVGNKIDMLHMRRVSEADHEEFIARRGLQGGFFVSAQSGDRVTRSFYEAAGVAIGSPLSEHELAFHDRVVGVTTVRTTHATGSRRGADGVSRPGEGDDEDGPVDDPELERIRQEDLAADARQRREIAAAAAAAERSSRGGCCAVM